MGVVSRQYWPMKGLVGKGVLGRYELGCQFLGKVVGKQMLMEYRVLACSFLGQVFDGRRTSGWAFVVEGRGGYCGSSYSFFSLGYFFYLQKI